MLSSRPTGGIVSRKRSTTFWTLLVLILAIGGMSLAWNGAPTSTHAPQPLHATPALLWTPLAITALSASVNPAFIGNATVISATVSGGQSPYTYGYSGLPPGCSSVNSSTLTCTATTVGNYTVVLTASDAGGNVTKNAFVLQVKAFTIFSFTDNPTSVSLGASSSFLAHYGGVSVGGYVDWTWSGLPAGCATANVTVMTCTPTVAGTFTVKLTGVDSAGPANAASVSLTITPVSVTSLGASPSAIYDGQKVTFTATVSGTIGAVTYAWSGLPTNCTTVNAASLTCYPRKAGTFSVVVTAKDTAGDTSSHSVSLTISPLTLTTWQVTPVPAYQLTSTTFTAIAQGFLGVVVGGIGTHGYPSYSYTGLPPGCVSANSSQVTCKPTQYGTFVVVAKATDPTGNSTTSTLTVVINPAAVPLLYVPMSTSFTDQPSSSRLCSVTNNSPFYSATCYEQSQDPSIVQFASGVLGVGYSVYTSSTTNSCPGASSNTNSRVAFALSSNNGSSFSSTVLIGNTVSCAYLDAIEPSFAVNKAGEVFGAFIEENSSLNIRPLQYGVRPADALGFVTSSNGGLTFSAVQEIDTSGNLAVPQIAVFGQTIYIVYEDIANSSSKIPGGYSPIALKFVYSTNAGSTWSTPAILPVGQNATSLYNAMNPSIALSSSGELALAFATDRSCVAYSGAPSSTTCLKYGSTVDVATSSANGTSWSTPVAVSMGVPSGYAAGSLVTSKFLGESTCMVGACLPFFFQGGPSTAVAFSASGDIYAAWSGTINNTVSPNTAPGWRWSAVGVSGSADNGATWSGGIVVSPDSSSVLSAATNHTNYYRPAIGITGNDLYL
ncbi:MAG TPA: hypothetical protein VMH49_04290, partial [Thermoplasmata archaeon]|nr:hypothetical protein [Thermoplasmata archaeon]